MTLANNRSDSRIISIFYSSLSHEKIKKVSGLIFLVGLALFFIWLIVYAITIVTTPAPVEYREGAILLNTGYLLRGMNPYSLANLPLAMNVYGIAYNLVVLPFAALFGNTLLVHRAISVICVLLAAIIITKWLMLHGASTLFAAAGGLIVLASLLFYVTPVTRPDALGELLFLSAIYLPENYHFDRKSLIFSSILSVLAFYTKPYFVLSFGIISAYLFLFISKKKGLRYFLASAILMLITGLLVNYFLKCYFLNTFLTNLSVAGKNFHFMLMQLQLFILVYLPIWIIIVIVIIHQFRGAPGSPAVLTNYFRNLVTTPDIKNWEKPFMRVKLDLPWFSFLIASLAIILVLGRHQNTYLAYLFQLMTPFLVVAGLKYLNFKHSYAILCIPMLLINLFILRNWILYPNDIHSCQTGWNRLEQVLKGSKNILNSPAIAPILIQMGEPIVDSGQSGLFYQTDPYPKTILAPDYALIRQRGTDYQNTILNEVNHKKFDKIIVTNEVSPFVPMTAVQQNYKYQETIDLGMPQTGEHWDVEVWVPLT